MVPIDVEQGTCGKVVLNQTTLIILLQQSDPRIFFLDDGERESGWFQIPGISASGKSIGSENVFSESKSPMPPYAYRLVKGKKNIDSP